MHGKIQVVDGKTVDGAHFQVIIKYNVDSGGGWGSFSGNYHKIYYIQNN